MRPLVPTTLRLIGLAAVLAGAVTARAADAPPPGGVADLAGPRALGLTATIGGANGNDGLFVNPGTIATARRYEAEAGAFVERRGSSSVTELIGGSVVDSVTSPIAAGFSYRRALDGDYTGNIYHVALAGPVVDRFYLGVTGKWLSLHGPDPVAPEEKRQEVSAATVDVGFLFAVNSSVSIGGVGYNLVPIDNAAVAPAGAGAGFDVGSRRRFHVTGDWRIDFDRGTKPTNRYSAGAEMLLGGLMPLRAGWTYDETLDTQWWSAGTGLVTKDVAIDVAYRQSLDASSARTLSAALRFYVFD